jgi:beta-1,4-mannosyltransferase
MTARVAVVVLGDVGRSPRMQYHALALADAGADVELVGHAGRPPDPAVAAHPRIRVHLLPPPLRQRAPRPLYLAAALADVAREAGRLVALLGGGLGKLDVILVQNPPALPTLAVAPLAARLAGARLVVDWHNFGYRMLALRLGDRSPLVRAAEAAERALGRLAHAHLCVSDAMREELAARWGIAAARVLRDRPARRVARPDAAERRRLFSRLGLAIDPAATVVVTSSSWSADEDFELLVEAMAELDTGGGPRRVAFVMTGDGPRRRHFEERIAALRLARVTTHTLWLEADDYPRLLAAADLGLSLHRSASGLDLPMKIADMFGAGLPVLALDYGPVLAELVIAGENGRLFRTASELAAHLRALGAPDLAALRQGVARTSAVDWAQGWRDEARPVLLPFP